MIKLKLGKKINCMNSNKVNDSYGRYDEKGRNIGSFAKYL